jgi:hypothetical protein
MELQCSFCKHICCNPEYDEMLDCELDLEENGTQKCYTDNFNKFELETDVKICQSYLNAFIREYSLRMEIKK